MLEFEPVFLWLQGWLLEYASCLNCLGHKILTTKSKSNLTLNSSLFHNCSWHHLCLDFHTSNISSIFVFNYLFKCKLSNGLTSLLLASIKDFGCFALCHRFLNFQILLTLAFQELARDTCKWRNRQHSTKKKRVFDNG